MAFFGKSLKSRKIDVNKDTVSSDDPEMLKRLDRIETNFNRLDEILTDLEMKFELDERLISELDPAAEEFNLRKKKPR
jgi:hypothetical protein